MDYKLLLLDTRDRIATITINRPDKLNALNAALLAELAHALTAAGDDRNVGVILITGAGRAFVAGADIGEIASERPSALRKFSEHGQALFRRIEKSAKPVIAAVNGFALGGGCELALACHVRIAADGAKFGLPEVKLGLIPGYGGTQRLPRLIGRGPALKLILTGDPVDATEAHRTGLADAVVPADKLIETARALAGAMLKNGPIAIERALEAVDSGLDQALDDALETEARLFASLGDTGDMREGTKAFLEKRPAKFTGA